jgi:hypothetical protein
MAQFLYLRKQADYLNRQAERFRSLARASSDKDLRASFLRLADQFAARDGAADNDDTAAWQTGLNDKGAA